jgi:hypothetical protein
MSHDFSIASNDAGLTWIVFENMDEDGSWPTCRVMSEAYAIFIANALTVCKAFPPGLTSVEGPEYKIDPNDFFPVKNEMDETQMEFN